MGTRSATFRDRWRHRGWWLLYQPYKFLVFLPVLVLSTLVLAGLTLLMMLVLPARVVSRLCGVTWARINGMFTPMAVSVEGRENLDPSRSYVIVSNHQSHYDVFVLYGWLGADFRWVMKQELRSVPGLGAACARLGHIYVDRSNRRSAMAAIEEAKKSLRPGTSVLFFAEGTRSRSGSLRPFKKGAFHMALDLGLPILPVTIVGTRRILPADSTDLKPGRARLVLHPPIPVEGRSRDDLPELMAEVQAQVESALE